MREPEILKLAEYECNGCPKFMNGVRYALDKVRKGNGLKKKVERIKYGQKPKTYDSIADAVMDNPICRASIQNAIKSGKMSKGYYWKEA